MTLVYPGVGASIINTTITTLGGFVWGTFGGQILNAISGQFLTKSVYENTLSAFADSVATSIALNVTNVSYQESYMYKKWSDYYDCYLIYFCLFDYSDSNRTNIRNVYHEQVGTSSRKMGL